jgi:gamma-glutamylcyclotransferase (GGCT)/AIG2-like uncharacterized protein YtfP
MLLFVYGTLRRGESNHAELASARFVGTARTAPLYDLVDLGAYPGLVEGGSTAVHGELHEVEDRELPRLDAFEEVPTLYERKRVQLSDSSVTAYVMPRAVAGTAPRIASGDWCQRELVSVSG